MPSLRGAWSSRTGAMPLRDRATPGRMANARVARVLWVPKTTRLEKTPPVVVSEPSPRKVVEKTTVPTPSASRLTTNELVRAAWHAFPGFLTVFLVKHVYPTEHHRRWRAVPVANALTPLLLSCWLMELFRLKVNLDNSNSRVPTRRGVLPSAFQMFFVKILRPDERNKVHGTAWYLLGVTTVLFLCPCDISVLSTCVLAFCDPAASLVGRLFGDCSRVRVVNRVAPKRFENGKSWAGSVACAVTGTAVTWYLFRPNGGVFGDAYESYKKTESVFSKSRFGKRNADEYVALDDEGLGPNVRVMLFAIITGTTVALVELFGTPAAKRGGERGNELLRTAIGAYKQSRKRADETQSTRSDSSGTLRVLVRSCLNDNFTIPLVSGAVCWAARGWLLGWE